MRGFWQMTMITAHSGCEGTPSGSEASLQTALASGADCLEVDLRVGGTQILLSHDPLQPGQSYLALDDCLELVRQKNVRINCDLKERAAFSPTLALFKKAGMDDRLLFTGEYPLDYDGTGQRYQAFLNVEQFPFFPAGRNPQKEEMQRVAEFYTALCRQSRIFGINLNYRILSDAILELLQNRVLVSCWTVDQLSEVERLLGWGVHNITTHQVCAAIACRSGVAAGTHSG